MPAVDNPTGSTDSHGDQLINGIWVEGGGEEIAVENPATEEFLYHITGASPRQVRDAVSAAERALPTWRALPMQRRAEWLGSIVAGLKARSAELADSIVTELGAPRRLTEKVHVDLPLACTSALCSVAADLDGMWRAGGASVTREPVGVAAGITPWNAPLHQVMAKVGAALLAGCTMVLKPSELTPGNARILGEVTVEAGLPAGVLNVVQGRGPDVGAALVADPGIAMVSFTGSTAVGRTVAAQAGADLKRVSLELGGKSALLALPGCDIQTAARTALASSLTNSGQACSALTRLLVPEDQADETMRVLTEAVHRYRLGDPQDPSTRLGPVVSDTQRQRVRQLIGSVEDDGGYLAIGGAEPPEGLPEGYFVRPTIVAGVTGAARIAQEEVFGPVLTVLTYVDEDEGVALANSTSYGLSAAVWSQDARKGLAIARRIDSGQVWVNSLGFDPLAPYGGVRSSGFGREMGLAGIEEFTVTKAYLGAIDNKG